jgi:hypothetical protein
MLVWSRFGLLASGPWEWDEALFARGMLDFNLAAHFPHPPGFPGWLAIGHLLLPLAGRPLEALQWASAALSVAALWPLAALGRRVAPPVVAVAAALVVLFAPGPWLHAVRGFSSTPAATFALLAAAVAGVVGHHGVPRHRDGARHRITLFTVLMVAAFLVRPILLPVFGALWLGVAVGVRPARRLLPGMAAGFLMAAVSVVIMVRAEGGWRAFVAPFARHLDTHFKYLGDEAPGFAALGIVKGLGGPAWSVVLLSAAGLGLWVWLRRAGVRTAMLWLGVLAISLIQLVGFQDRTYTRYAVPTQLALAPLIAGGAALAPPPVAAAGLLAGAVVMFWRSLPLLDEQHSNELPGWTAVTFAAAEGTRRGVSVVVGPELHPFASYLWHALERDGETPPVLVLSPWGPEEWRGVGAPYLVATSYRHQYPQPMAGDELMWGGVSARLEPLTQQRLLEAWVINNPPLPVTGWWPVEFLSTGKPFMWGEADCELALPPMPEGVGIDLRLQPAPGPAPLTVELNGRVVAEMAGTEGVRRLHVAAELSHTETGNRLRFARAAGYPPGTADVRPLSVQLLDLRLAGSGLSWGGSVAAPEARDELGVRLEGHHRTEQFGPAGPGVWTEPGSRLVVPAAAGTLVLTVSAPRPSLPMTRLRVAGVETAGPLELTAAPVEVELPVAPSDVHDGVVEIELDSVPYTPALAGHGLDQRALGIVLHRVRFEPETSLAWARPFALDHRDLSTERNSVP